MAAKKAKKAAKKPAAKKSAAKKPMKKVAAKKPAAKEEVSDEAQAERRFHEADDAELHARRRRRIHPDAPDGSHQQALGLHQEEQPSGQDQPPHERQRHPIAQIGKRSITPSSVVCT